MRVILNLGNACIPVHSLALNDNRASSSRHGIHALDTACNNVTSRTGNLRNANGLHLRHWLIQIRESHQRQPHLCKCS